jgi:uncharacterized radical SAM superfamily protein
MDKQNFKVFGDQSLLKDCKINIVKNTETGFETKETLLLNGNLNEVKSLEDDFFYKIYISYKDSLVNKFDYDNIMGGEDNQINHFYIYKNKDIISLKFVGDERFLKTGYGFDVLLISLEDYFKKNKIDNEESKNKEKKLFFDYYK